MACYFYLESKRKNGLSPIWKKRARVTPAPDWD